jgi:hypothetical protein
MNQSRIKVTRKCRYIHAWVPHGRLETVSVCSLVYCHIVEYESCAHYTPKTSRNHKVNEVYPLYCYTTNKVSGYTMKPRVEAPNTTSSFRGGDHAWWRTRSRGGSPGTWCTLESLARKRLQSDLGIQGKIYTSSGDWAGLQQTCK